LLPILFLSVSGWYSIWVYKSGPLQADSEYRDHDTPRVYKCPETHLGCIGTLNLDVLKRKHTKMKLSVRYVHRYITQNCQWLWCPRGLIQQSTIETLRPTKIQTMVCCKNHRLTLEMGGRLNLNLRFALR